MRIINTLFAALVGTITINANAENEPDREEEVFHLEPVVITASRYSATIESAPARTTVITAKEIEQSGATNLAMVLENVGGIQVQDLFGIAGARSQIDMGGFGSTGGLNTLVLVNGRRLNDVDLSGANLASIPIDSVERIEVIHGSTAVLYGDNAVAGTINIVTKDGFQHQQTNLNLKLGSYRTQEVAFNSQGNHSNLAYALTVNSMVSNGYRDNSAFEIDRMTADIQQKTKRWKYGARLYGNKEDLQLPGPLNEPVYEQNPTAAGEGKLETAEEKRYGTDVFISGKNFAAELGFSNKKQDATVYGDTHADLTTWSLTPRYNKETGRHKIIVGLDAYHSVLKTEAVFAGDWPSENQSDTTRKSYALYANDNIALTKRTSLAIGARRQTVKLDIESTNLLTDDTTQEDGSDSLSSWDASLSQQYGNKHRSYLRFADAFRFPVLDELWNYFSGTIRLLKPQKSRHFELGTENPINQQLSLKASLFHIKVKDEIAYNNLLNQNINLDATQHNGLDIGLNSQLFKIWNIVAMYAYRDATFDSGANKGKTIPLVPKNKFTFNNRIQVNRHISVALIGNYVGKRYFGNDFANEGKQMPSYVKWDLTYLHDFGQWKGRAGVINLTDKSFADVGFYSTYTENPYFYYPLPERSFYAGVEAGF